MKDNKIFTIRNKETKETFVARSGKRAWGSTGAAKNAFNQSVSYSPKDYGLPEIETGVNKYTLRQTFRGPRFDEQEVYELVEVRDSSDQLEDALQLLGRVSLFMEDLPVNLSTDIRAFFDHYDGGSHIAK